MKLSKISFKSAIGWLHLYADDSMRCVRLMLGPLPEEEISSTPLLRRAQQELEEYFAGKRRHFTVPLYMNTDTFAGQVQQAMLDIEYGTTVTYGELAARCGRPRAFRAAGSACHSNPLPIFVPCHRVIGKTDIKKYGYGWEVKRQLFELEGILYECI